MHARKLPRISEPSFDKDYYENGRGYASKYSSSGKMRSYGGGSGSSSSYRRSVSPDIRNQSPRDRNGPKHHSIRRLDRDHQHKYSSSRKDRDRGVSSNLRDRSPKERGNATNNSTNSNLSGKWDSQSRERESTCGGGGGTNSGGSNRNEPKIKSVADWTEHISSSGKKYYYNSVSEISQWEKPREWLDYERLRGIASSASSKTPSCDLRTSSSRVLNSSSNGSSNPVTNSLIRTSRPQRFDDNQSLSTPSSNDRLSTPSSTVSSNQSYENPHIFTPSHHGHALNHSQHQYNRNQSENYESVTVTDMDTSPQSDHSPSSVNGDEPNTLGTHHSQNLHLQHQYQPSPSSGGLPSLQTHPQMTTPNSNSNLSQNSQISDVSPYSGASPPTPTHSEQENQCDSMLQNCNQSQQMSGPIPLQNVGSLTQVVSSPLTALKPQPPLLTPSLAKLYRESLISHVTGWPSEIIEKACHKVNEEHQNLTNLALTRLNSEIKSLRSSLRVQDVFTTLHEQRALSLRLMNQELEAMSPTGGLMPMEDMSNSSTQLS